MTKPFLIGLTGLAGAGKDTVRNVLAHKHGFEGIAFADPMRNMLTALLETCDISTAYLTERELKERPIPELGVSYRAMAQELGTGWGRALDQDLWLKIAQARVKVCEESSCPGVVISDVRFPNEAAWIKSQGGVVWRIIRPGIEPVRTHESEAHANTLPYDYTILNQGTIDDLIPAVAAGLRYDYKVAA